MLIEVTQYWLRIVFQTISQRPSLVIGRDIEEGTSSTSITCRQFTRATESCCRQSLNDHCDKLQRSSVGARRYCQLS